jgi:hypothetical protein
MHVHGLQDAECIHIVTLFVGCRLRQLVSGTASMFVPVIVRFMLS